MVAACMSRITRLAAKPSEAVKKGTFTNLDDEICCGCGVFQQLVCKQLRVLVALKTEVHSALMACPQQAQVVLGTPPREQRVGYDACLQLQLH